MKKLLLTALILSACISSQASSVCRNAMNSVIYKTAGDFAQLQVTDILNDQRVLKTLDLSKHDILLSQRRLLDLRLENDEIVSTSSVSIRVTKKNGELFPSSFMDLSEDLSALQTMYICQSRESALN